MTQSLARAARSTRPPQPSIPLALPSGSTLVRLLATLNETPVPASKDAFAERLSRWFEWMDAISLSGVLEAPIAMASGADDAIAREVRRVRTVLEALIDPATAPVSTSRHGRSMPASFATSIIEPTVDFASFRKRYVALQRDMSMQIAPLRERLRAALSTCSPEMAKLAALDAVMERVIGEREHVLLATVARWLEPHFKRLCASDADTVTSIGTTTSSPNATATAPSEVGIRRFSRDFQAVLRAELDLRWQPIDGLMQAIRRHSTLSS